MSDDPYLSRIEEYLDEDLPESEMAEFRAHVETCPECGREVGDYRRLRRLALAFPPVEVPDDLGFRIRRRLQETVGASRKRRRRGRIGPLGWTAGVAAAAAILIIMILPDGGEVVSPPPSVFEETLSDWLVQAKNGTPEDLPMLVEEARMLDLLSGVRSRLAEPWPGDREFLLSVEYLLVQLENDPSPEEFAGEAGLVAMARLPMKSLLVLSGLLLFAAAGLAEEEPAKDPKSRFWEARKILLKGDPKSAAELFRTVASKHPTSDVADDCYYWMGRCHLRMKDHEAEATVAFLRLVKDHPESPFTDDAARELARLGDRSAIPELKDRLKGEGKSAEMAARALAEFDEESGIAWLEKHLGKDVADAAKPSSDRVAEDGKRPAEDELRKLKEELRRLKKEVEENVALLKKLLSEKAAEKGAPDAGEEK